MSLLLAVLIGLVQMAGPWLCCCCRPVAPAVAPVTAPAPERPACPHCCTPAKSTPDAPAEPACPTESRLCCSQVMKAATVPADAAADWARLLALGDFPPVATNGPPADAAADPDLAAWVATAFDSPFLTTAERLYAHHVLLC